jgi:hypothetical protein
MAGRNNTWEDGAKYGAWFCLGTDRKVLQVAMHCAVPPNQFLGTTHAPRRELLPEADHQGLAFHAAAVLVLRQGADMQAVPQNRD